MKHVISLLRVMDSDFLRKATIALGLICLFSMMISVLALNDIYHSKEGNLNLEWNMVRTTFLTFFTFLCLSLYTMFQMRRKTS